MKKEYDQGQEERERFVRNIAETILKRDCQDSDLECVIYDFTAYCVVQGEIRERARIEVEIAKWSCINFTSCNNCGTKDKLYLISGKNLREVFGTNNWS